MNTYLFPCRKLLALLLHKTANMFPYRRDGDLSENKTVANRKPIYDGRILLTFSHQENQRMNATRASMIDIELCEVLGIHEIPGIFGKPFRSRLQ